MARLLTNEDYIRTIQEENLDQVIESNYNLLLGVEQAAQAQMVGYLKERYLTDKIFTNTTTFSTGATYLAGSLVQYTAPSYNNTIAYSINDHVVFSGVIFSCISSTTGGTAPNSATTIWSAITADKSYYYAKKPCADFDFTKNYSIGDQVFFNDKVYAATNNITGVAPGTSTNQMDRFNNNITYGSYNNWFGTNVTNTTPLPSANTGSWVVVSGYSFSGIYCEDSNYWIAGDNRNQLIVQYLLDITLYHLFSRINPRNISQLRFERYQGNQYESSGALGWLKAVAAGDISADLPEIVLPQGLSISWGSVPRNTSSY